jgi:hypothetical protein
MKKQIEDIEIKLTGDEALVLFEFLARFDESQTLNIIDQSEERALWNLHAVLQKQLAEPFNSDYKELLNLARNRLRDQAD